MHRAPSRGAAGAGASGQATAWSRALSSLCYLLLVSVASRQRHSRVQQAHASRCLSSFAAAPVVCVYALLAPLHVAPRDHDVIS